MFSTIGDVSDRGEIIPVVKKCRIGMHPVGGNNPCGAKEQDRDASDRGKVIPVVKKCRIGMNPSDQSNPFGTEKQDSDADQGPFG